MPTILITGTNRGIGLELVRQYAADGWQVIACCRNPDTASELKQVQGIVDIHALDVTSDADITRLAGELAGKPIDVLLNNAGITAKNDSFGSTDTETWLRVFHVNCIAPLHLVEALVDNLAAGTQKKAISISTRMGSMGESPSGSYYAYRSSKAALNMAMVNAAADLRGRLILAMIHPGWVQTDMGGTQAPLRPQESVAGIRRVIAGLKPVDSGQFFNHDGSSIPW
ncbi:SDR family oxidoreductase [Dongia soli]|uniref:SDR family oxidoreductase n=1 Tax=Dongia soli TaxID=600628 RepID=A0ABU5EIS3_9PROT|nr:SDR family oxidoreductase [Dongia soli]MDY0885859.1 SDR family oxidoreductase [Dongia soli]